MRVHCIWDTMGHHRRAAGAITVKDRRCLPISAPRGNTLSTFFVWIPFRFLSAFLVMHIVIIADLKILECVCLSFWRDKRTKPLVWFVITWQICVFAFNHVIMSPCIRYFRDLHQKCPQQEKQFWNFLSHSFNVIVKSVKIKIGNKLSVTFQRTCTTHFIFLFYCLRPLNLVSQRKMLNTLIVSASRLPAVQENEKSV